VIPRLANIRDRLMPLGIPVAWRQLSAQKLRLCAAVAGIAFAAVMMMMQLGFRDALFRSTTLLHERLNGDLIMISQRYESLVAVKSFTQRRLQQALAFPDVTSVASVCVGGLNWKNPQTLQERDILVIGIQPDGSALDFGGAALRFDFLKLDDVVLFDSGSREEFGPVAAILQTNGTVTTEVAGRKITVGGLFKLGTSFAADGNIIASDTTFRHLFGRASGIIDIGVLQLKDDANPREVRNRLAATLPTDVRILTRNEFMKLERGYWANRTPIGFVIMAGMIVGFIVGSVIVYQILYTDVVDHLNEYATLKAIGYTDQFLFGIVLQEAVILSLLGFFPGCVVSIGIFALTRKMTLLPAYLTLDCGVVVLALTTLMCCVAGYCAMRKLKSADPAEIF
jgi:putative ABC transport system permease protein